MNNITKWFLEQSPRKMFFLFLFGLPFYIWLFSIYYQLEYKTNKNSNKLKLRIIGLITIYPIVYFLYVLFTLSFFTPLMPFHILAMFCGFMLMIISTNSLVNFEKNNDYSTHRKFETFFMIWFYLICIWSLQRRIKKYVNN